MGMKCGHIRTMYMYAPTVVMLFARTKSLKGNDFLSNLANKGFLAVHVLIHVWNVMKQC